MVDLFYNQQKNKKMQVKIERKWHEKAGLDSGVN
jgi:hypothetical protein